MSMPSSLPIVYEQGDSGRWIATIPEVPGAFSRGKTKSEARENVLDALAELMAAQREAALRERGDASESEDIPLAG